MRSFFGAALMVLALAGLDPARAAESGPKIRIAFPSPAFSYLPFYVAQEKGLLKKLGLEAEYIQMRTTIQPQATLNGEIDFFPSVSTGISAAVSGLPLVVVLNLYDGSPWILVAAKDVNKAQDFAGKKIAISGIRTSPHYFAVAGFKKLGLDEKDVGFISTGGTASSFAALASGQVAGAVLTPPFDDKAVSLGFKKFLFLGDLVDIPYVGLVAAQPELKSRSERARKTIAALLEAVAWLRANREAAVRMVAEKFVVNQQEAERTYQTLIGLFSKDNRLSPKVARGYLEILRRDRPVPPDLDPQKFLDFSLLPPGR
ncbi:MAG: ABC transporter substrate-binding protein [Candidatus Binatia bacterium]